MARLSHGAPGYCKRAPSLGAGAAADPQAERHQRNDIGGDARGDGDVKRRFQSLLETEQDGCANDNGGDSAEPVALHGYKRLALAVPGAAKIRPWVDASRRSILIGFLQRRLVAAIDVLSRLYPFVLLQLHWI